MKKIVVSFLIVFAALAAHDLILRYNRAGELLALISAGFSVATYGGMKIADIMADYMRDRRLAIDAKAEIEKAKAEQIESIAATMVNYLKSLKR